MVTTKNKRFLRKDSWKILRLGKKKKKLRKWRRSKGKHSKIREKRRGYLTAPEIGYRNKAETRGLVFGMKSTLVHNADELKRLKAGDAAIIGKIGRKKKIELAKIAVEKKIKILNLKTEKFLKKIEKEIAEKKAKKEEKKKVEKKKETEVNKEEKPKEAKEEIKK